MKRRGRSGKPRKRRRAVGRKPRTAPAASVSIADLQRQLDQRTRDRDEALEQQAATAEILSLISNSPTDTLPAFKTILAKAVELCEASFGAMWFVDGKGYRTAAMHGDLPRAYLEQWRSGTLHLPKADIPMVRAIRSRKTIHTPDMRQEKAYLDGDHRSNTADISRTHSQRLALQVGSFFSHVLGVDSLSGSDRTHYRYVGFGKVQRSATPLLDIGPW